MGTVYICHHIDTEGPLWETLPELFGRLKFTFGISLDPTYENLGKIQRREIDVSDDVWKELSLAVDPHTVGFKKNWGEIDVMLDEIMSSAYRTQVTDSFGGGWIFNWHVMDHVGFSDVNPRHRDYGYHNIFDYYQSKISATKSAQDSIHWHFHPVSFHRAAHIPATSYDNSMTILHSIICRRLIDKRWFPVVNRAGFHTERIDANLFLEQWIPFDPSNQAVAADKLPAKQKDLINGRYGDWRGAPDDWSLYHPSFRDWRQPGDFKRTIARILNMKSRHRNISTEEIARAFKKAAHGEEVYLGITNHDWRDMKAEIDEFRSMLMAVAPSYPSVKFKFSETVDAFRKVLKYNDDELKNGVRLKAAWKENVLEVSVTDGELFGPQPYLAIKTVAGEYLHDNFDFHTDGRTFFYTFDAYTIPLRLVEKLGIASNDKFGNQWIEILELN